MTGQGREVRAEGERTAGTGINNGIVSLGNNANNVMVTLSEAGLPAVDDIQAPPGTIRLGGAVRSGAFVGREAQLAALAETGGARVLVGLGGSGKSTIARVFARERADRNPVWWIDARSEDRIEAGLAQLAIRLAPIIGSKPNSLAAAWARSWLAQHPGWLLVLDDADRPDKTDKPDETGETGETGESDYVKALLDELPDGEFLLTSRRSTVWQDVGRVVPVGDLSLEEATQLLELVIREVAENEDEPDLTGAAELCERLGRLPLAIEQAGAFIARNVCTPAEFLADLDSDGTDVVLDFAAKGEAPNRIITQIWRVTFERLAKDELAADILRVLAWFAPTDIPRNLEVPAPQSALRAALNLLAGYRLVTLAKDAISVHPLVQEIARTPSREDPYRTAEQIDQARAAAITLLSSAGAASGTGVESWPAQRRLFPHMEALAAYTRPEQDSEHAAALWGWLGQCKDLHGDYRSAIRYLDRAVHSQNRQLETLPDAELRSAVYRLGLAMAHRHAGDAERGLRLLEEAVAFATQALGATHQTTLTARAVLGAAYSERGEHEAAVAALRTVLELTMAEHGEDSAQIGLARNNLAGAMALAGLTEEAAQILEDCYDDHLANLGQDHPSTLAMGHNLAFARREAGRLDAAIELFEQIAEGRARALGSKHPDTLVTVSQLAGAKVLAHDFAGARSLTESLLADQEEVLGPDHPNTRDARQALATLVEFMEGNPQETTK